MLNMVKTFEQGQKNFGINNQNEKLYETKPRIGFYAHRPLADEWSFLKPLLAR